MTDAHKETVRRWSPAWVTAIGGVLGIVLTAMSGYVLDSEQIERNARDIQTLSQTVRVDHDRLTVLETSVLIELREISRRLDRMEKP